MNVSNKLSDLEINNAFNFAKKSKLPDKKLIEKLYKEINGK